MKIGAIIFSRFNSSRLPGKVLREINEKPLILYIYERLLKIIDRKNIVVATSVEETDNPVYEFCIQNNINCFRGALDNVAKRFLDCSLLYNFDYSIRITGDSIFIDTQILKEMIGIAQLDEYDLISNRKNRTFPVGMSVDIVKTSFYQNQYSRFQKDDHFEHVTTYFFENEDSFNIKYFYNEICPQAAGIHLAVDERKDFELVERIIKSFKRNHTEYGLKEIFELYQKINEQKF